MSYFPLYDNSKNKVQFYLDLSHYSTKLDWKTQQVLVRCNLQKTWSS